MKTGAPMRRILTCLAAFTLIAFTLIVIRETAAVVTLAREFHPVAGQVTLWRTLVLVYGICLGVPLFLSCACRNRWSRRCRTPIRLFLVI
jgi:hypothetical protein